MQHFLLQLENYFSNKIVQLAGILSLALGYIADAIGDKEVYLVFAFIIVVLLMLALAEEIRTYNMFHMQTIHIPVVIRVDDSTDSHYVLETLLDKIEKKYDLRNYKENLLKYRGINLEEFIFEHNGDLLDFNRLLSFSQIINYKINQVEKTLKTNILFHIAYYRRPSVAFLLGIIFRTEGVVLYQNDDGGRTFQKVVNVMTREYKERVVEFEKYDLAEEVTTSAEELLFVINSASHNVDLNVKSLKAYKNRVIMTLKPQKISRYNGDVVEEKMVQGTIPGDNWIVYSQEIYTVLHDYRLKYEKIIIVHAMPEALAFLVGMSIENYWNIEITQYHNSDYVALYNMQQVKFYF